LSSYSNSDVRQIIFDAYINPKYKTQMLLEEDLIAEHSNVCVDDLRLKLVWKDDVLTNAKYEAVGCGVFLASCDLAIDLFLNKSKTEISKLLDLYFKMINKKLDDKNIASLKKLEKLQVFENVKVHLNRLECASIIYRAFKKAL